MIRKTDAPPILGKLGKKPKVEDKRTLKLARYLDFPVLPTLPTNVAWQNRVAANGWPMLGNDRYGDCVEAGFGHAVHLWTANAQDAATVVSEQDVLGAYTALTGFNPNDPSTDEGTDMLAACRFWRDTGMAGNRISAFVECDVKGRTETKAAIDLFGVAYLGLALPLSAQSQPYWHNVSGTSSYKGSWGGHCVAAVGYTKTRIQFITWGQLMEMTWGFYHRYAEEAYALLADAAWFTSGGTAPNGFNMMQLQQDLNALAA